MELVGKGLESGPQTGDSPETRTHAARFLCKVGLQPARGPTLALTGSGTSQGRPRLRSVPRAVPLASPGQRRDWRSEIFPGCCHRFQQPLQQPSRDWAGGEETRPPLVETSQWGRSPSPLHLSRGSCWEEIRAEEQQSQTTRGSVPLPEIKADDDSIQFRGKWTVAANHQLLLARC